MEIGWGEGDRGRREGGCMGTIWEQASHEYRGGRYGRLEVWVMNLVVRDWKAREVGCVGG